MTVERKPLSKRVRFEVFKRDGFACVYCGGHPPAVILHVDHIHPLAEGGTDDEGNLVTACAPCNLGKGAALLSSAPQSLADRAAEVAEREEQIRGYREVMDAARARVEADVDRVAEVFERFWDDGHTLSDSGRMSVRRFFEQLGVHEVVDAAEKACTARIHSTKVFRYFCGICWRQIRGD